MQTLLSSPLDGDILFTGQEPFLYFFKSLAPTSEEWSLRQRLQWVDLAQRVGLLVVDIEQRGGQASDSSMGYLPSRQDASDGGASDEGTGSWNAEKNVRAEFYFYCLLVLLVISRRNNTSYLYSQYNGKAMCHRTGPRAWFAIIFSLF